MTRETGKWPGIPQKEGKSGNFHSIILFLKKENFEVRFCVLFSRKNKLFLSTFNNLRNISPKLYFLGEGGYQYKRRPNISLNLQVKCQEFSEKEIRKNRESAGNLEMGNS